MNRLENYNQLFRQLQASLSTNQVNDFQRVWWQLPPARRHLTFCDLYLYLPKISLALFDFLWQHNQLDLRTLALLCQYQRIDLLTSFFSQDQQLGPELLKLFGLIIKQEDFAGFTVLTNYLIKYQLDQLSDLFMLICASQQTVFLQILTSCHLMNEHCFLHHFLPHYSHNPTCLVEILESHHFSPAVLTEALIIAVKLNSVAIIDLLIAYGAECSPHHLENLPNYGLLIKAAI